MLQIGDMVRMPVKIGRRKVEVWGRVNSISRQDEECMVSWFFDESTPDPERMREAVNFANMHFRSWISMERVEKEVAPVSEGVKS